jgi:hypothetical protein
MSKVEDSEIQESLTELMAQLHGQNGRQRLDEFNLWLKRDTKPLLTFVRTVGVTAQSATITSKKYFEDVGVKRFGGDFESQFFDLEVLADEATELAVRKLERDSFFTSILIELGGKVETSVPQFRQFLSGNRESSEDWHLFYLRGKNRNLWAVIAEWYPNDDIWGIIVTSVDHFCPWRAGIKVVSRV